MAEPFSNHIRFSVTAGVAELTLDNPGKQNAIDLAMWREISRIMAIINADASIRAVLVRGEGGHFAAGGDLEDFATARATLEQALIYHEEVARVLNAIRHCAHPTLAMIRGSCIGGGLEIAACCDIRICDTSARFGAPINRLGFSMYPGEMAMLLKVCGASTVAEMLLEARVMDAEEAVRKNIVSRMVAPEALQTEVDAALRRILAGAPKVATWHKHWLRRLAHDAPLSEEEKKASFAFLGTNDYREGLAAFLEKRKPEFTGK
ncbi:MAG: enoyl-CoA hydratase/isomerase family protein [Azoarcus sp.]|jgi:enoyl-CoA hydratase/carnithine racemase|nr:enoyl-CoA hydratase/isomerase family protein [Azoarcus sp.]